MKRKEVVKPTLAKPAPHEIRRPILQQPITFERATPGEIAAIRERLGLSRDGLATILGMNRNQVYVWERGQGVPTQAVTTLLRLLVDSDIGLMVRKRLGLVERGPNAA